MNSYYFFGLTVRFMLKTHLLFNHMVLQVLQGLEAATNCVEDMDEWLGIFNVKLRHMREDIESVETSTLNFVSDDCVWFTLQSLFDFC